MRNPDWRERLRAATLPGERMMASRVRAALLSISLPKKRGAGAALSVSPELAPHMLALLTRARISYTVMGEAERHVMLRLHYPRGE